MSDRPEDSIESELLTAAGVIFDGLLAGALTWLVVRSALGRRPVELPTGASSFGLVVLAASVFACGIALSLRERIASRGNAVRVNGLVGIATVLAASQVVLPAWGVNLPNATLGPAAPFLGTTMLSILAVFALLFGAFVQVVSDRRLLARRAVAATVDGVLALALTYALVWIAVPAVWRPPPTGATWGEVLGIFAALLLCSILVRVPFELVNGGSVGKYLTGIRVTDQAGEVPGVVAVCLRNLLRPVDSLPVGYVVGLGWAAGSGAQRRLGDVVAGTRVEKR